MDILSSPAFGLGGGSEPEAPLPREFLQSRPSRRRRLGALAFCALLAAGAAFAQQYTIGGVVFGMAPDQRLTLTNNGAEDLIVTANGYFVFTTRLAPTAAYAVTVKAQPYLQQCTVANGAGTVSNADIINITVTCVPSRLSHIQSFAKVTNTNPRNVPPAAVANNPTQLLLSFSPGTQGSAPRNMMDPTHSRIVLGYMLVADASPYNTPELFVNGTMPSWFGCNIEGVQWLVQYWNPAWKPIIFKQIDNIIANGYDGIFLDVPYRDAEWLSPKQCKNLTPYPDATAAMAQLLTDIVGYVKSKNLSNFYLIIAEPYNVAIADPSILNGFDGIFLDGLAYNAGMFGDNFLPLVYSSYASIFDASGLPVFGVELPPQMTFADAARALTFFSAHGWIPSINGLPPGAGLLSTGPFMAMAVPSKPVVTGSPRFVNFLSGGLVSAATLIGGDQGDYFIGGPGANIIKGGAGDDLIYAHPASAALRGMLDIQIAGVNINSVAPTFSVLVNGQVALSGAPVTADQTKWAAQHFQVDISGYGKLNSVVIRADNADASNPEKAQFLCLHAVSLSGVNVPLDKATTSGRALPVRTGNSVTIYLNSVGTSVTFPQSALEVAPSYFANTSDTIDGGGGANTVVYGRPHSNYSAGRLSDGSILVTAQATPEGLDRLTNIQKLQFADQTIETASLPQLTSPIITSVVNGANFKSEAFSPGAWISIMGQNLGGAGSAASAGTTTLGGASVSICGTAAVLSYNSGPVTTSGSTGWQINALVPDGVAGQTRCPVVVTVSGLASQPVSVAVASGIMELFQFSSSAGTLPIVTHADYSLVGPPSAGLVPAKPGETVIAWGTGDCATPSITLGGTPSVVAFSGRVGPGLCQINFTVPSTVSGNPDLTFSTSPSAYKLWVSP